MCSGILLLHLCCLTHLFELNLVQCIKMGLTTRNLEIFAVAQLLFTQRGFGFSQPDTAWHPLPAPASLLPSPGCTSLAAYPP